MTTNNEILIFIKSNCISFVSLIFSIISFLHTYIQNRFNIKIKIKPNSVTKVQDDNNEYNFSIDCEFTNQSKNINRVIKVRLNKQYYSFNKSMPIKGSGFTKFSHNFEDVWYTFDFPLLLDTYDYRKGLLLFSSNEPIKLHIINLLTFYTTRGKSYKLFINIKNKQ